jgi:hypothetical protein
MCLWARNWAQRCLQGCTRSRYPRSLWSSLLIQNVPDGFIVGYPDFYHNSSLQVEWLSLRKYSSSCLILRELCWRCIAEKAQSLPALAVRLFSCLDRNSMNTFQIPKHYLKFRDSQDLSSFWVETLFGSSRIIRTKFTSSRMCIAMWRYLRSFGDSHACLLPRVWKSAQIQNVWTWRLQT